MKLNNTPSIFVIFGAVGDLSTKKIIPSLWHLFIHNRLPDKIAIIGFSRTDLSKDEFIAFLHNSITQKNEGSIDTDLFDKFVSIMTYIPGVFEDQQAFKKLSDTITTIEDSWGTCSNKLFYLATPPLTYKAIFTNLASVELNLPCGGELGWSRVLIEKPFGLDLTSSQELQSLLATYFKEEQIYRIDHYLFKEIVQGIENFRFSNNLFETSWDNTTIERIDIKLHETLGVENRGSFYDSVGTLRDVGQNHLLAMLSAVVMEYPKEKNAHDTQACRAKVLELLEPWSEDSIKSNTVFKQYEGYQEIQGVAKDSQTETFFSVQTQINHPKWTGVDIHMQAGKRMPIATKEITVTLKLPKECLSCQVIDHEANKIIFRMEPNDEINIYFYTKKPGFDLGIEERIFSFFLYEKETQAQYVEEYAKIIYATIGGDQTRFISHQEVENSWKFIDPVENYWKQNMKVIEKYKPSNLTQKSKQKNELAIIGLGKMGANLARSLSLKGWSITGYNKTPEVTDALKKDGIKGTTSLSQLVQSQQCPRTIWLMVPHSAVDGVLEELVPLLSPGDTIIDGGNSPYKDSIRRGGELSKKELGFLDVGVSGGPGGALEGACIMVGGDKALYEKYDELFKDLSVEDGYRYMGDLGAGHFVKMVHNGIEYGMMQSIAEGFHTMKVAPFNIDLPAVAELYNHGSVVNSSLIGWLSEAYKKYGSELIAKDCCSPTVSHSGEAEWTVAAARELSVPVTIIEQALEFRKNSAESPSYTGRVLSAMRHQFGGHDTRIE